MINIKKTSAIIGGAGVIIGSIFGIMEAKKSTSHESKIKTYILYRDNYIKKAKESSDQYISKAVCGSINFEGCSEYSNYLPQPHENEIWNKISVSNKVNNYAEVFYTNIEDLKDYCYSQMHKESNNNFENTAISGTGYFQGCVITKNDLKSLNIYSGS